MNLKKSKTIKLDFLLMSSMVKSGFSKTTNGISKEIDFNRKEIINKFKNESYGNIINKEFIERNFKDGLDLTIDDFFIDKKHSNFIENTSDNYNPSIGIVTRSLSQVLFMIGDKKIHMPINFESYLSKELAIDGYKKKQKSH